jgi:hypothetical protein
MIRAGFIFGIAVNLLVVLLLLLAFGWVIDSWHDTRVPYTGVIVTTAWLVAMLFAAGSPALAYGLHRRNATPGHVLVTLWLPTLLLITLCVVGLIISPLWRKAKAA